MVKAQLALYGHTDQVAPPHAPQPLPWDHPPSPPHGSAIKRCGLALQTLL